MKTLVRVWLNGLPGNKHALTLNFRPQKPTSAVTNLLKSVARKKCPPLNTLFQKEKKLGLLKEDMTMSLSVAGHLLSIPASSALWLPGRPNKQAAVARYSAGNAWRSLQKLKATAHLAMKI